MSLIWPIKHQFCLSVDDLRDTSAEPLGPNLQSLNLRGYFSTQSMAILSDLQKRSVIPKFLPQSTIVQLAVTGSPAQLQTIKCKSGFDPLAHDLKDIFADLKKKFSQLRNIRIETQIRPQITHFHVDGMLRYVATASLSDCENLGTIFASSCSAEPVDVPNLPYSDRLQPIEGVAFSQAAPWHLSVMNSGLSPRPVTHAGAGVLPPKTTRILLIAG